VVALLRFTTVQLRRSSAGFRCAEDLDGKRRVSANAMWQATHHIGFSTRRIGAPA
jgi:hypothetical protein